MGTRNLTIIKLNGEIKVAKYCQWDGYPTGQGKTLAKFIQNGLDVEKLKKNVLKMSAISEADLNRRWRKIGVYGDTCTFEQSDKFREAYPELSRDIGAEIVELIQNGSFKKNHYKFDNDKMIKTEIQYKLNKRTKLLNDFDFLNDHLFCEFAYLIDLDKQKIEVYAGTKKPVKTYTFKSFTEKAMESLEKKLNDR